LTLAPQIYAADIVGAWKGALPRGRIWPRDPDTNIHEVLSTFAPLFSDLAARDANLLVDAFPATTYELLPEWEATLGLPDPCSPLGQTVPQRVASVLAKLLGHGPPTIARVQAICTALGMVGTVTEYAAFRANINCANDLLRAPSDIYTWTVGLVPAPRVPFLVNMGTVNSPLATYPANVNEAICRISRMAPAHTRVQFALPIVPPLPPLVRIPFYVNLGYANDALATYGPGTYAPSAPPQVRTAFLVNVNAANDPLAYYGQPLPVPLPPPGPTLPPTIRIPFYVNINAANDPLGTAGFGGTVTRVPWRVNVTAVNSPLATIAS